MSLIFHDWDGSIDWMTNGLLVMMAALFVAQGYCLFNIFTRR